MEWGWSDNREGRGRTRKSRSRSRSIDSRSDSYQSLKRLRTNRRRSLSRSSDSDYKQELKEYSRSRKSHNKRSKHLDSLPSGVALEKLSKVMASLVPNSSGKADMAPDFDPENRSITSEAWCNKMDDLKVIFNWNDESAIYFAAAKLRGLANAWYNGLPNREFIWTEFKDKLKSAFPSKRNYYELLHQMMARRKLGNETYVTFYYDKLSLLKACNISGEDAVSCVVAGITDQVVRRGAESADFNGLEALLGYLTAFENIPSSSKEFPKERKFLPSKSNIGCYICGMEDHYSQKCPQQLSRKSATSCYNCGHDGHFAKDCRNVSRCFRCGGEDHFVIDCQKIKQTPASSSGGASCCYMCGVEGHIAQFCPDARKIRSKNCFVCNKRGHLAIACPSTVANGGVPIRCTYCNKIGHLEDGCYNKKNDLKYDSQQEQSFGRSKVEDPYDVYEDFSQGAEDKVLNEMKGNNRQIEGGNGQMFLSDGELGSEHSG